MPSPRTLYTALQVVLFFVFVLSLAPLAGTVFLLETSADPDAARVVRADELGEVEPGTFVRIRGTIRSDLVLDDPEWLTPDPERRILRADRRAALHTLRATCVRWNSSETPRSCLEERLHLAWVTDAELPVDRASWSATTATVDGVPFAQAEASLYEFGLPMLTPQGTPPLVLEPADVAGEHTLDIEEDGCFNAAGRRPTHCVRMHAGTEDGRGDVRVGYRAWRDGFEGVVVGSWDGSTIVPHHSGPQTSLWVYVEGDDAQITAMSRRDDLAGAALLGLPSLACAAVPFLLLVMSVVGRRFVPS